MSKLNLRRASGYRRAMAKTWKPWLGDASSSCGDVLDAPQRSPVAEVGIG